jgi:hypothetical protein
MAGMHECPGAGCTVRVPLNRLACLGCWDRVPRELKCWMWDAQNAKDVSARLAAGEEILRWLHANPPPVKRTRKASK